MKNLEQELEQEMFKNLYAVAAEEATHTNKIKEALSCLNHAASTLDQMNQFKFSDAIMVVINKVAKR